MNVRWMVGRYHCLCRPNINYIIRVMRENENELRNFEKLFPFLIVMFLIKFLPRNF